jgi:putative heme iron utilization protein
MHLLGPKNKHDIGVQAYLDISYHLDVPNCTKIALTKLYFRILRVSSTLFLPTAGIAIPDCGKTVRSSKAEMGETR